LSYIPVLAKIGKGVPGISFFSRRFSSSEFEKAVEFLYQNTLQPKHILGGILFCSTVLFCVSAFILNLLINTLSAMILSGTIALMSSLILLNSISTRYRQSITQIEKHAPYVLEELTTIFTATGSIFESIQYVSKGGYEPISSSFSEMISPLNLGVPPEQLLTNFATHQPSITLRRGIIAFIQFAQASDTSLDSVIIEAHESLQRHYERLTLQWESRMMVYSGLLVFLPIIILLGAAIRGLAENPLILILPIFQFGISKMMQKILFPNELVLLGE